MIMWHGDLREQGLVLGTAGNYQAAPIIFPIVHYMQPWGAGHSAEVVLVLGGNIIAVNHGIYVVRRRGRLAPRQPLSVCALLPAYEGNRHLRPLGNLGHRLRRPRWIDQLLGRL